MTSIVQQNCQTIERLTKETSGWRREVLVVNTKWGNIALVSRERIRQTIGLKQSKISKKTTRRTTSGIWRISAELNNLKLSGGSRGRARGGGTLLIFGPNWGPIRRAKKFFWVDDRPLPPPPLSEGLDSPLKLADKHSQSKMNLTSMEVSVFWLVCFSDRNGNAFAQEPILLV